jgi:hypothetical protein
VRARAGGDRGLLGAAFDRLVFEPMHHVMERKMLIEIKARAEGRAPTPFRDGFELLLWALVFGVFLAVGLVVLLLKARAADRKLAVFAGAGIVFAFITLVGPSLVLAFALVFALFAGLIWAFERGPERAVFSAVVARNHS